MNPKEELLWILGVEGAEYWGLDFLVLSALGQRMSGRRALGNYLFFWICG